MIVKMPITNKYKESFTPNTLASHVGKAVGGYTTRGSLALNSARKKFKEDNGYEIPEFIFSLLDFQKIIEPRRLEVSHPGIDKDLGDKLLYVKEDGSLFAGFKYRNEVKDLFKKYFPEFSEEKLKEVFEKEESNLTFFSEFFDIMDSLDKNEIDGLFKATIDLLNESESFSEIYRKAYLSSESFEQASKYYEDSIQNYLFLAPLFLKRFDLKKGDIFKIEAGIIYQMLDGQYLELVKSKRQSLSFYPFSNSFSGFKNISDFDKNVTNSLTHTYHQNNLYGYAIEHLDGYIYKLYPGQYFELIYAKGYGEIIGSKTGVVPFASGEVFLIETDSEEIIIKIHKGDIFYINQKELIYW